MISYCCGTFCGEGIVGHRRTRPSRKWRDENHTHRTTLLIPRRPGLLQPNPLSRHPNRTPRSTSTKAAAAESATTHKTDVVIVGAGIIGLSIALSLLHATPTLKVTLVDTNEPCAIGSTGAGQGYLWMAHRTPSTPAWHLASHSIALWDRYLHCPGGVLEHADVEWQKTGSLLLGTSEEEGRQLEARAAALTAQGGLRNVSFIDSAKHIQDLEPALFHGTSLSPPAVVLTAVYAADDVQINGRKAAAVLLAACRRFSDRFKDIFYDGVDRFIMNEQSLRIEGVVTSEGNRIVGSKGVVVAAGAWGGVLLGKQYPGVRNEWYRALVPRRGLLLEVINVPRGMPRIQRGLMEQGYTKHYNTTGNTCDTTNTREITFTATTSASNTLLLGSSREFCGFDQSDDGVQSTADAILDHATRFIPHLSAIDRTKDVHIRFGPRPFSPTGYPIVGGIGPGVWVAAGHEGSGLTLGPATAELITHMILEGDEGCGAEGNVGLSASTIQAIAPPPSLVSCDL